MTAEIASKIPAIGDTDGDQDPLGATVAVKFFAPGRYTFYATEFDGDDTLFGYCVSPLGPDCDEWGYASLKELAEMKIWGIPAIERDIYFGHPTVGEALGKVAA
jgi:hypothetical protein